MTAQEDIVQKLLRAWRSQQDNELDTALRLYREILEDDPDNPDALHMSGVLNAQQGRNEAAIDLISRSIAVHPDNPVAFYNLGRVLRDANRHEDALHCYDRAVEFMPRNFEAWSNRGTILLELDRPQEAIVSFDRALEINPDHVSSLHNRANALRKLTKHEQAIACYDQVLALEPANTLALNGRGAVLQDLGRYDEALKAYERVFSLDPDFPFVEGWRLHAKMHLCDWTGIPGEIARLARHIEDDRPVSSPYVLLAAEASARLQLKAAKVFCREHYPPSATPLWRGERYDHGKIRLGYVSGEFFEQATAYLTADLYECHNHERFELHAISTGRNDGSATRKRLERAFDRFSDVSDRPDRDIAELIRRSEIDILINLNGYFGAARQNVFAMRPAPVQVNYLGYPGTMGSPYMDYIIADRTVIPVDHLQFCSEKVAYLPDTYQPNDRKKRIGESDGGRSRHGLPVAGFVFCCFNNSFKVTPDVFDIWMRLLAGIEGSALWLYEGNATAARNLKRETQSRGIAPERIVFAPFMRLGEHLARVQLGDLFLDTLPFNAHGTASDALWCGVPVLTCQGSTFAGRVASSLLEAVGLPELVTRSLGEYEALALELARNPAMLGAIRARLKQNRETAALFDTPRYTRSLEAAYTAMWERCRRGESPASFVVAPNLRRDRDPDAV